jgi:hypothetical protein
MYGDADLAVFTADFGIAVTFQGSTAKGILNQPQKTALADQGFGGISTTRPTIRLPYNAFTPMPEPGETINVDGVDYAIADEDAESDGAFVWFPLKVAS